MSVLRLLLMLAAVGGLALPVQAQFAGDEGGPLRIQGSGDLGAVTVGQTVNIPLSIKGGEPPYALSTTAGALPLGLIYGTGSIVGIPLQSGTFNFTTEVRDADNARATKAFTLRVAPLLSPLQVNAATLADGTAGTPYTQSVSASGGVPPYQFSVSSGALPGGLTLAGNGTISGTPASAGTFSFTVRATDLVNQDATRAFSIAIAAAPVPVSLTTAALPPGTAGTPYSAAFQASGGTGPYTFSVAAGALPAGLTLAANGALSGTPTTAGTFVFTVRATDARNASGTREYSLAIAAALPPPSITNASLPGGTQGTAYSAALQATGGTAPYVFAVTAGALPNGLTLNPNGALSGTPAAAGSYPFTIRVTDAANRSGTRDFTIAIDAPPPVPLTIAPASLPNGTAGTAYSAAFQATGGTAPYAFAVGGGSLPAGLVLNPNGTLSGTPTAAGTFAFAIRATDPNNNTGSRDYTIMIAAAVPPPAITTTSLPNGTVGAAYTATLQASGGTTPYTFSLAGGSLPAGLTLTGNGAVTGTPAQPGSASFTVRVTDAGNRTATRDLAITIGAAPTPPTITTGSLPGGTTGTAYSAALQASGGTGPYSFALANGSLPAGLSLAASGTITGTPTQAGTASFTARVTDAENRSSTRDLAITIVAAPAIATPSLPSGTTGTAYSAGLQATGGTAPYSFVVASGSLPPGLTLASNGNLSGTPTQAGSFPVTIRVTDSAGRTSTRDYTIAIVAAPVPPTITTSALPNGRVGSAYTASLQASGGTAPYTFAISGGALPAGVNLNPNGTLAGTPTTAGNASFTVRVTDAANQSGTRDYTVNITPAPAALMITTDAVPGGTVGTAYSASLVAAGGTGPYSFAAAAGNLPPGITLSGNGALAGTPTQPGSFSFTARVTDAASQTATRDYTIAIVAALSVATESLPSATAGAGYTAALQATGGSGPYTFSLAAGGLPPGLTLSATGAIAGTPTAAGTASFTVRVTDARQASAQRQLTITVAAPPPGLALASTTLPPGTTAVAYNASLQATGGTGPYSFSIASGRLPEGLNLAPSGLISGTPQQSGAFSFSVRVADAAGAAITRDILLIIGASVNITSDTLPNATAGAAYSAFLQATGGALPYRFEIVDGALPAGLTLAPNGTITGTPRAAGSAVFTVQVTDAELNTARRNLTLTVAAAPARLTITTPGIPAVSVGSSVTQTLGATGGTAPYTFTISAGALPEGLNLTGSGVLTGTPTRGGTYTFTVQVTDATGATATQSYTVAVAANLTIATETLPAGTVGTPYRTTVQPAGGTGPYLVALIGGALPAGLTLTPAGELSGTPATDGRFTLIFQATDAVQGTARRTLTLVIAPAAAGVTIATSSLPGATLGAPYSQTIAATGGNGPYTFALAAGSLPAGITLSAGGLLSGIPTQAGSFPLTVRVTDASGRTAAQALNLAVVTPNTPVPALADLPATAEPGQQVRFAITLDQGYPQAIEGQIALSFSSNAENPADDPAVQFATGGRVLNFTIPAGATRAEFAVPQPVLLAGTVAGTITINTRIRIDGREVTPAPNPRTVQVPLRAPAIRHARLARRAGGFDVVVTGVSSPRAVTEAVFRLIPANGANLETREVTVPVDAAFNTWFRSAASVPAGSQFTYTQPFRIQGDAGTIASITVELRNRQGASNAVTVSFQ